MGVDLWTDGGRHSAGRSGVKATVFGAGNIGRGLVGVVLDELGYQLAFVDADADLISRLAAAGSYDVRYSDGTSQTVDGAAFFDAGDQAAVVDAVASSCLIATAVGEPILQIVAEPIGRGLAGSDIPDINVLACENVHPNSPLLREHVEFRFGSEVAGRAGYPEVIVDRIIGSAPGSVELTTEAAYEFIVDRSAWRGPAPAGGITLVDDVGAYEKRKLWLVNGLHAALAFLGLAAGHTYAHEAMATPAIAATIAEMASSTVAALEEIFPDFPAGGFAATAAASLERFHNAELPDTLTRIARNPLPKLATDERVVGPALAAHERGLPVGAFADVIAAMLSVDDTSIIGVDDLGAAFVDQGWRKILSEVPADLLEQIEQRLQGRGNAW